MVSVVGRRAPQQVVRSRGGTESNEANNRQIEWKALAAARHSHRQRQENVVSSWKLYSAVDCTLLCLLYTLMTLSHHRSVYFVQIVRSSSTCLVPLSQNYHFRRINRSSDWRSGVGRRDGVLSARVLSAMDCTTRQCTLYFSTLISETREEIHTAELLLSGSLSEICNERKYFCFNRQFKLSVLSSQ